MNPEDVQLNAVNWEHGMLLTPDHFLRQERYFEASLLWALRYASTGFGLVGGGPRLPETERGAVRHDPVVSIDEDELQLRVSVTQCRAITPAGCIIDIDPQHPIARQFEKMELEGVPEARIYIVCDPAEKLVIDGPVDEFNPQMRTERRPAYAIKFSVPAADAPYAVSIARLRKQRYGSGFEKDPAFIPPCTALISYSELAAAWRKIVDSVTFLAERYTELQRAMREFQVLFAERGIETEVDSETLGFADRMVVALQNCVYELLDPVQPPQNFFGKLRRLFHSAAVYLDLAPTIQQYFNTLKDSGETEFIALVDQQKKLLKTTRTWAIHDDLAVEVREVVASLNALQRLERALEGKYLDFHVNPSLEAMNFVFDRGGRVLYKLAAKESRVQGVGDELTLYFAQLKLEGREKYRLILAGEKDAVFEAGAKVTVEIRVNEGSGFRRPPILVSCVSTSADQRNFDYDFEAPDVPTITDIRVSVQAHYPIRSGLLYTRHRFYAQQSQEQSRRLEPLQPAEPRVATPQAYAPDALPAESRPSPRVTPASPAPWERPRQGDGAAPPNRSERPLEERPAPWDGSRGVQRPGSPSDAPPIPARRSDPAPNPNDAPPPPRRRRLE